MAAVNDILNRLTEQQAELAVNFERWTTHMAEIRQIEYILEKIMMETKLVSM